MRQTDLFAVAEKQIRDLNLRRQALRARDEAVERAERHANAVREEWSLIAYTGLLQFLRQIPKGMEFTTEAVRDFPTLTVSEPPDRRAWGGIMLRAARAGLILKVGYFPHRDPSRHGAPSTVWVKA